MSVAINEDMPGKAAGHEIVFCIMLALVHQHFSDSVCEMVSQVGRWSW